MAFSLMAEPLKPSEKSPNIEQRALVPQLANQQTIEFDVEAYFLTHLAKPIKPPKDATQVYVSTSPQLYAAIKQKVPNRHLVIWLRQGTYVLPQTLNITADDVYLLGTGQNPFDVILAGNGMRPTSGVDNLIRVTGDRFVISNMTLEQAGNHLIQFASESGADAPIVQNIVFQEAYEQHLKVSFNQNKSNAFSRDGIVRNCLFRYQAGIGPNWYIGGIDAHGVRNWLIEDNLFVAIASPGKHIAEHAIHLWNATYDNIIRGNVIIDSDRGIGLGMRNGSKKNVQEKMPIPSNIGGVIEQNIIYHSDNAHPYADVGIILEDSPKVLVKNNIILMEHDYPNAIEVRFNLSNGNTVTGNLVNKRVIERNGGEAFILNNTKLNNADLRALILKTLDN